MFVPGGGLPSLVWLPVKVASTALAGLAWAALAAAIAHRFAARRRRRPGGTLTLAR